MRLHDDLTVTIRIILQKADSADHVLITSLVMIQENMMRDDMKDQRHPIAA